MKTKAERIRQAIKETLEKRKNQVCRVYQLKLQNLSEKDVEQLMTLVISFAVRVYGSRGGKKRNDNSPVQTGI